MRLVLAAAVMLAALPAAAQQANQLPEGSVAIQAELLRSLLIYFADRPSVVSAQIAQALAAAAQAKPAACPVPPKP